jgi:hypothetical protein
VAKSRGRLGDPRVCHDPFFRKARASGFAARAVFKLEEIDQRLRLLHRKGMPLHRDLEAIVGRIRQRRISLARDLGAQPDRLGDAERFCGYR